MRAAGPAARGGSLPALTFVLSLGLLCLYLLLRLEVKVAVTPVSPLCPHPTGPWRAHFAANLCSSIPGLPGGALQHVPYPIVYILTLCGTWESARLPSLSLQICHCALLRDSPPHCLIFTSARDPYRIPPSPGRTLLPVCPAPSFCWIFSRAAPYSL